LSNTNNDWPIIFLLLSHIIVIKGISTGVTDPLVGYNVTRVHHHVAVKLYNEMLFNEVSHMKFTIQ